MKYRRTVNAGLRTARGKSNGHTVPTFIQRDNGMYAWLVEYGLVSKYFYDRDYGSDSLSLNAAIVCLNEVIYGSDEQLFKYVRARAMLMPSTEGFNTVYGVFVSSVLEESVKIYVGHIKPPIKMDQPVYYDIKDVPPMMSKISFAEMYAYWKKLHLSMTRHVVFKDEFKKLLQNTTLPYEQLELIA